MNVVIKENYLRGGLNKAVILLKCAAALLITYSHMDFLFPQYGSLATGGAIGDGLFFFCSGYTLLLGRKRNFPNWYKRRISRIYPTVIMWALLSAVMFNWKWSVTDLVTTPNYWFISCIMVYYVLFYIIRTYLMEHLKLVVIGVTGFIVAGYFLILDFETPMMYADVAFMQVFYFSFMLLGAMVAISKKQSEIKLSKALACFTIGVVLYYVCMAICKLDTLFCRFQLFSLIPLLFSIYWLYRVCETPVVQLVLRSKIGAGIYFVSCLTLEIYMVQYAFFTDEWNGIFPLNILLTFIVVIIAAYLLKCAAKLFSQVFSENEFSWRKIYQL